MHEDATVTEFDDWYVDRTENPHTGCIEYRGMAPVAMQRWHQYDTYKREMDLRVANYWKLEKLADAEVLSEKPDLPNISSGETAGLIRRTARNLVQHTPNVEVTCEFDDDSVKGIFARHILKSKIIGDDQYSNDMQQNLFASAKTALALGFTCVIPVLLRDAGGGWFIKYDTIHHRDVFPEPGTKDIRQTTDVFVRRYLTQGDVRELIREKASGWDHAALREMLKVRPPVRERQSVDHQTAKHHTIPEGYELITWYSSTGDPFLTFNAVTKMLLRIEKNKHPLRQHPVHFLVMEKDDNQPLGKSQVELILGRQEFQDLMLNGAMKMWYRNINPAIIGYGTVNSVPNLSPGKYTQISNPNAKVEAFEVNTQSLLQFGAISQQNAGAMVQMVGAADQQMAAQNGAGQGMSATPQGVEAQQQMVDITTNNYQKAIESFFSHYCSYALTIFFQELKATERVVPSADARKQLVNAGLPPDEFDEVSGVLKLDFKDLATIYFVRCVPGSLVEMEDEKQIRVLNEMFVPLSQAMPALANTGDPTVLANAAAVMQFIIQKQIELSGSAHSTEMVQLFKEGQTPALTEFQQKIDALELSLGGAAEQMAVSVQATQDQMAEVKEQMSLVGDTQTEILNRLGVPNEQPTAIDVGVLPAA